MVKKQLHRMREMLQLHKHFRTYFQVVPAVTPELIQEAQMIRHDVYCAELGWEPVQSNGMEVDEYDDRSLHCLLKAVKSQRYIGCVRLILPDPDATNGMLPLQLSCRDVLDPGQPNLEAMKQGRVAEVSRLAIISDYRRRKHEQGHPVAIAEEDYKLSGRRRFPYIPVGLYIGMLHLAARHNIEQLYFITEPMLAVHFSRLGGKLQPIGQAIEHRGKRKPYVMDVQQVLKKSHFMLRPLIRTIKKDLEIQLD